MTNCRQAINMGLKLGLGRGKKEKVANEYIFWKKPIGDNETFRLLLFFIGNRCLRNGSSPPNTGQPKTKEKRLQDKSMLTSIVETGSNSTIKFLKRLLVLQAG